MKRDSVVIYRNLYEALQKVGDKSYKRIMNAILKYSLDGEESNLNGAENAVFQLARTQIDANNRKYENGKKGAASGSKGGRPKKEPYDQIIKDFELSPPVENKVRSFLQYLHFNKMPLTNDEFEGMLVELDMRYDGDDAKIRALDDAMRGNFKCLRRQGDATFKVLQ